MAIRKISKENIIKKAINLFKQKGYCNTSMSNIANECGLLKGSLYHHFKSKEEIAIVALEQLNKYFYDEIFSIAYENAILPRKRLEIMTKKTDDYFLNSVGGCLFGNLASEVSKQNQAFKDEIIHYFSNWSDALVFVLKNFMDEIQARIIAKSYITSLQGEILMINLYEIQEKNTQASEILLKI